MPFENDGKPDQRRTILIVDDIADNLDLLANVLRPEYRVRVANSGSRALGIAAAPPHPDLILLDVMMPAMDGHEVIGRLKADAATRDIPVIFVTSLGDAEDEKTGFSLGAVDYITKPINPAVVLARVRAHIELKEIRDRLAAQKEVLEKEVADRTAENLVVHNLSVRALACIAEARLADTSDHILRVQSYVAILARKLPEHIRFHRELTGARIDMLVRASALHDLGKIGIPDSVLLKPGSLSPEEFSTMQLHTSIGAEAIGTAIEQARRGMRDISPEQEQRAFALLGMAREICLSHHERWDGAGYPQGLSGEAIPITARLVAVADVYDALTTRRVYKAPIRHAEASDIIGQGGGSQFDPDLIEAFNRGKDAFAEIAMRNDEGGKDGRD